MSKIQAKYKGNGVYEFDFKGKIKDNTMLKIAFKKDKLFIKTIKNKQKFKKMKKSKESFESLEQSIIEMIRFMETNPEKEKKEFEKKENLKNEMELLEKNITEFAQNKAKEAILEALKNMKIEPQKEKKEVDIEYYLNFTSKDASKEGQEAYDKQLIEIIEKIKEAAKEGKDRCTFNNVANEVISLLKSNGFFILTEIQDNNKIVKISW